MPNTYLDPRNLIHNIVFSASMCSRDLFYCTISTSVVSESLFFTHFLQGGMGHRQVRESGCYLETVQFESISMKP